jgi:AcrR family transcriptional regulator
MGGQRIDRRVERTRAALLQAFVDLVLQDGFDAVTVDAVAARANVGRSTYYMHFHSKHDILQHAMAFPNRALARLLDDGIEAAEVVPMLEHFHAQRRINRVFYTDPVRTLWIRGLAAMLEPKLAHRKCATPMLPLPLIAQHLAELEVGLIARWLQGRYALKPQAVAEALLATVRASTAALLPS